MAVDSEPQTRDTPRPSPFRPRRRCRHTRNITAMMYIQYIRNIYEMPCKGALMLVVGGGAVFCLRESLLITFALN